MDLLTEPELYKEKKEGHDLKSMARDFRMHRMDQKKEALRKEANAEVMKAELAVRTEKLDGVSNEEEWEAEVNKLFDELPDGGVPLEAPGEAMNADI